MRNTKRISISIVKKKIILGVFIFLFFAPNFAFSQEDDFNKKLAEKYAPILCFHKDEKYYPCSPLFWLENGEYDNNRQNFEKGILALTPEERKNKYDELRKDGKHLQKAKIYYNVYQIKRGSKEYILLSKYIDDIDSHSKIYVIEYWFYYIYNEYHIGYKILKFKQNHFHDMEHVFFIVAENEKVAGDEQDNIKSDNILLVVANAHEDSTPNNIIILKATEHTPQSNIDIIVEKGSHASCPDIDGDGFVVACIDINDKRFNRIEWGIRDHGQPFSGYIVDYMDRRIEKLGYIKLYPPGEKDTSCSAIKYKLISVNELHDEFNNLFSEPEDKKKLDRIFSRQMNLSYLNSILIKELEIMKKDPGKLYQPWEHPHYQNIKKMLQPVNRQLLSLKLGFTYYNNRPSITLTNHIQFRRFKGWPLFKNFTAELSFDEVEELIFDEILKKRKFRWVPKFEYNVYLSYDIDNFFSLYGGIGSTRSRKKIEAENNPQPEVDWVSFIGGLKFNYYLFSTRIGLRVRDDIDRGFIEFRVWINLFDII